MTHTERAWAAGFFDGEGSTVIKWSKDKRRTYIMATVGQTNPETLKRFQDAVGGYGKIFGPYRRAKFPHWAPAYKWVVDKFEHTQMVMVLMWPYLSSPKRQQFKQAFQKFYSTPRRPWIRKVA